MRLQTYSVENKLSQLSGLAGLDSEYSFIHQQMFEHVSFRLIEVKEGLFTIQVEQITDN